MQGISSRSPYRKWFKNWRFLPIPSVFIYSLMLFVAANLHYFQTKSSVHKINTRHLHTPAAGHTAIQSGTACSVINIFNKLPQLESQN